MVALRPILKGVQSTTPLMVNSGLFWNGAYPTREVSRSKHRLVPPWCGERRSISTVVCMLKREVTAMIMKITRKSMAMIMKITRKSMAMIMKITRKSMATMRDMAMDQELPSVALTSRDLCRPVINPMTASPCHCLGGLITSQGIRVKTVLA